MHQETIDGEIFIREADACRLLGIKRGALYAARSRNRCPIPHRLNHQGKVIYRLADVMNEVARRAGFPVDGEPTILTTAQAAAIIGCPGVNLRSRRVTHPHSLPFHRIGNRVYYRAADVHAFKEKQERKQSNGESQ